MTKGKRSVALFEVIQSGKTSSRGISLRTPKWWFKNRKAAAPPAAPPSALADPEIDRNAPAPRVQGVDLKLDTDRQRIKFDVSYTSAIVAAFAVIVIVSMAYVIGTHLAHGPAPAIAGSTELLRQKPAQPSVLDVGRGQAIREQAPIIAQQPIAVTPKPAPTNQALAEQTAVQSRIVGRNYIVILGHPDEKVATTLRDYMNQNGIPCTIEHVSGFAPPSWSCVVTVAGFDRISQNPDYEKLKKSIMDVGAKAASTMRFKLDPQAYRWK